MQERTESKAVRIAANSRLVGIVRLDNLSNAVELTRALIAGGIRCIEFTLTNPEAVAAVSSVLNELDEFRLGQAAVGVGSVRSEQHVKMSVDAGAEFVVTPTLNPAVILACQEAKIPVMCGAFTPTEILSAWDMGADIVKVFPARNLGPAYIRDVLAPLPELRLMPTGGINTDNAAEYLAAGAVALGIGGNLVSPKLVSQGQWHKITEVAAEYVRSIQGSGA